MNVLLPPIPCGIIHATTSWSTSLKIYFRQEKEQADAERFMPKCCGRPCRGHSVTLAVDADMWERIWGMVDAGNISSIFISKPDVYYSRAKKKVCVLGLITNKNNVTEDCLHLLQRHTYIQESQCLTDY